MTLPSQASRNEEESYSVALSRAGRRAKRLSNFVLSARLFIYLSSAIAAALAGWLQYAQAKAQENVALRTEMRGLAHILEQEAVDKFLAAQHAAEGIAATFIYPEGGRAWFPQFSDNVKATMKAIRAHGMCIGPIVTPSQVPALNEFLRGVAENVTTEGSPNSVRDMLRLQLSTGVKTVAPDGSGRVISGVEAEQLLMKETEMPIVPLLQAEPIDHSLFVVTINVPSEPRRRAMIGSMLASGAATWGGLAVWVGDYSPVPLLVSELIAPSYAPAGPPASPGGPPPPRRLAGAVGVSTSWMEIFQAVTSPHQHFDIVFSDGAPGERYLWAPNYTSSVVVETTKSYTMRVTAGQIAQLGFGDQHDASFDEFAEELSVKFMGTDARVKIRITPTKAYVDQFVGTGVPATRCGMIVAIVGGIACVFIAFDLLTRNHTAALSMLMASERLEAKTEREIYQRQEVFGRMIAHEIRTPASSICGALDLLRTLALDSTTAAYVDIIAGGADQILTLVEDMMTSGAADSSGSAGAAGQGNNPADFRLSPIVVDPVEEIVVEAWNATLLSCERRYKGMVQSLSLDLSVGEGIPHLAYLDAGRARQVISNIVGNAIKFTAGGAGGDGASASLLQPLAAGSGGGSPSSAQVGRVAMTAEYLPETHLLKIEVKDTGRGLSEEGLARLFKPFAQAEGAETKKRFGGTGLGLCISRGICQALGGDLTLSSEGLGKGCTVVATMRLPAPPPEELDNSDLLSFKERLLRHASRRSSHSPRPSADGAVSIRSVVVGDGDDLEGGEATGWLRRSATGGGLPLPGIDLHLSGRSRVAPLLSAAEPGQPGGGDAKGALAVARRTGYSDEVVFGEEGAAAPAKRGTARVSAPSITPALWGAALQDSAKATPQGAWPFDPNASPPPSPTKLPPGAQRSATLTSSSGTASGAGSSSSGRHPPARTSTGHLPLVLGSAASGGGGGAGVPPSPARSRSLVLARSGSLAPDDSAAVARESSGEALPPAPAAPPAPVSPAGPPLSLPLHRPGSSPSVDQPGGGSSGRGSSSRRCGSAAGAFESDPKLSFVRVLAAEDDAMMRRVLSLLLRTAGFHPESTVVGDGVALTDTLSADLAAFQLIILDANMGGGESDGIPTMLRIRALYEGAKQPLPTVVFLTGEADADEHALYRGAGANHVVVKPVTLEAIKSMGRDVARVAPAPPPPPPAAETAKAAKAALQQRKGEPAAAEEAGPGGEQRAEKSAVAPVAARKEEDAPGGEGGGA